MCDYSELHKGCDKNISGYCSRYNYNPVSNINFRCDDQPKKKGKNEKEKVG